jgi:hypothetical protein
MTEQELSDAERHAVRDLVYHRFIHFQPGMMLIRASEPNRRGHYRASETSVGDNDPPVAFLNSLDNINDVKFIPDLSHRHTIEMIVARVFPGFTFEMYTCPVWKESGWRLVNYDRMVGGQKVVSALTGPHTSKAAALVWSLGLTPPF